MNIKDSLHQLEEHFYRLGKYGGWPLALIHYEEQFEDQVTLAAAFIARHPKAKLYWDTSLGMPSLCLTKMSMQKTVERRRKLLTR